MLGKKYPTPRFALKRHLQALSKMDTFDRLPEISVPTLILTGEEDKVISSENSMILAERIPNAQLKIFKGVGHLFTTEIGDQIEEVVMNFLSENRFG